MRQCRDLIDSGDVDIYGLELDAQFAVNRYLTLEGSLGTTKYRLKDPTANGGRAPPDRSAPQWVMGRPRDIGLSYQHWF